MGLFTTQINTLLALEAWNSTGPPTPAAPVLAQPTTTSSTASLAWTGPAGTYTLQRAPVTSGTPGTYATVYTGTTASYTDGPLTFNTAYAWRVKVTVGGVDSPYSNVVQATTATGNPKLLLFHDNSQGAYYYQPSGTWIKPPTSFTGTPNAQQFSGKLAALLTTSGAKVINNSYPGFNLQDAITNGPAPSNSSVNVVADVDAVIAASSSYDIDLVAGWIENGFDIYTLAQMKQKVDSYITLYLGKGIKRIFFRVPVNRAGAYSNTVDGDIYTNIVAMRAYLRQKAAASGGTVFVAADSDGPNITAQGYPQNGQYCNQNDGTGANQLYIHFTEPGVTEQANELRVLLTANGYTFSGPATSNGTGGVSGGGVSQTTTTPLYKQQPSNSANASIVNGSLVHQTDGAWDCNTPLSEQVARPQTGETIEIKVSGISLTNPQSVLLYVATVFAATGLANVLAGAYKDTQQVGAYGTTNAGTQDFLAPPTQDGTPTELSLQITATSIAIYAGGTQLATKANTTFPLLVLGSLNRQGATLPPVSIKANTHQASPY